MAEPTVEVPVSLIRSLHAEPVLSAYHRAVLAALLSQPTPTAEPVSPRCLFAHTMVTADGRCGRCGAQLVDPRGQADAPPRIADMAPGTTFVARPSGSPRWLAFSRLPGADPDVEDNEGDRWRWFAIDPSTIRDVTPPSGTEDAPDA